MPGESEWFVVKTDSTPAMPSSTYAWEKGWNSHNSGDPNDEGDATDGEPSLEDGYAGENGGGSTDGGDDGATDDTTTGGAEEILGAILNLGLELPVIYSNQKEIEYRGQDMGDGWYGFIWRNPGGTWCSCCPNGYDEDIEVVIPKGTDFISTSANCVDDGTNWRCRTWYVPGEWEAFAVKGAVVVPPSSTYAWEKGWNSHYDGDLNDDDTDGAPTMG